MIFFVDGNPSQVSEMLTLLDEYLFKCKVHYVFLDFPLTINQYGCNALFQKDVTNQFLLSWLSFKNTIFNENCCYIIRGSFFEFFLQNQQLIYCYLTLRLELPNHAIIIIDANVVYYKKINQLLNHQILYFPQTNLITFGKLVKFININNYRYENYLQPDNFGGSLSVS